MDAEKRARRYAECMQWAAAKATIADTYRVKTPATLLSATERAQAIREAQDEAEVFYLAAQQYVKQEAA